MKKQISLLLLTLFSFVAFSQQGNSDVFRKESFMSTSGNELPYRLLIPENFDSTKKYPLVLFLHGAGERGNDNEAQLKHGTSIFTKPENRTKFSAFVLVPQCPKEDYWASAKIDRSQQPVNFEFNYDNPLTPALESALELLDTYRHDAFIDTNRVYITGLSMGGMGTFEAVAKRPDFFAAAAPICGGGDPRFYGEKTAKVAFWIFHGAKDNVVSVEHSRTMYKRIRALGGKVIYKEYPNIEHNSWENAFAEETFLPWMFAMKR